MAGSNDTEVIVLDFSIPAMEARRKEGRAIRAVRHGIVLKVLLGSVVLLATLVTLVALLRR